MSILELWVVCLFASCIESRWLLACLLHKGIWVCIHGTFHTINAVSAASATNNSGHIHLVCHGSLAMPKHFWKTSMTRGKLGLS